MIECDLPHLSNGNWIPPVVHFRISFSSFFFFYSTSKTYQLYLQNKFRIWLLLTISTVGQSHHHILPGFFYLPGFRTLAFSPTSEKAMAPHSSTLAWKIPWTEEPGRLQSLLRVRHDWATSLSLSCIGEGNGNPFQCSCLENPRDGGAWWAAIYGVAQSRTWLKWLSSLAASLLWILQPEGLLSQPWLSGSQFPE